MTSRPRLCLAAVVLSLVWGSLEASAARVQRLFGSRKAVLLSLNPKEQREFKSSERIKLEAPAGDATGKIMLFRGGRMRVRVTNGFDLLAKGDQVGLSPAETKGSSFSLGPTSPSNHPFGDVLRSPWVLRSGLRSTSETTVYPVSLRNPAQAVRVSRFGGAAGFSMAEGTLESDIDSTEDSGSSGELTFDLASKTYAATGIASLPPGIRLGLYYAQGELEIDFETKFETAGITTDSEASVTQDYRNVAPLFAVNLTETVAVGAQYNMVETEADADDGSGSLGTASANADKETSYTRLEPGVVYHDDKGEVGVRYSPPIHIDEDDESAESPRSWHVHVMRVMPNEARMGGFFTHKHYSAFGVSKKDYMNIKLGGEKKFAGPAHGSAFLLYNSRTYREDEDANAGGIPTYGLELNGDRLLQNDLRVGGSLSYLMGDEEVDDVDDTDQEHSQSRWRVAIQLSWTG